MRRDMELIRQIALVVESANDGIGSEDIRIAGYSVAQVGYHCDLMNESGLIDTIDIRTLSSDYPTFHIKRLTSKGHDFVDAARNNAIWNKAMATIATAVGGVTIDVMIRYLKFQTMAALGMPTEES